GAPRPERPPNICPSGNRLALSWVPAIHDRGSEVVWPCILWFRACPIGLHHCCEFLGNARSQFALIVLFQPFLVILGVVHDAIGILFYPMGDLLLEFLGDRKSTRLNSSHVKISYAVFCLKKKNKKSRHCHLATPAS